MAVVLALTLSERKLNSTKALSTLATIVAKFGDNFRRQSCQSPFSVTVAAFGDSRRFWRQSPNSATIVASVASVDRA